MSPWSKNKTREYKREYMRPYMREYRARKKKELEGLKEQFKRMKNTPLPDNLDDALNLIRALMKLHEEAVKAYGVLRAL